MEELKLFYALTINISSFGISSPHLKASTGLVWPLFCGLLTLVVCVCAHCVCQVFILYISSVNYPLLSLCKQNLSDWSHQKLLKPLRCRVAKCCLCSVLADWRDAELMRDIEAATGEDLGSGRVVEKGKKKKKKKKFPNLSDLKQNANTSRSRLEKKVFNKYVTSCLSPVTLWLQ